MALTPGRPYRSEPRLHPYTVDGRQVDVCWDGEWVKVWECGLAHPAVLEAAGPAGWRPVSAMPPVRRDLSVAVQADDTVEDLGGRVRDALGPDADAVEEVTVLAETPADRLPAAAVARLGIDPDQKNVLVRVVLRHLERTLTDEEANRMRDRIYTALHRGGAQRWAARPG